MGYTTEFEGKFTVTPPLDANQVAYLNAFSKTRRMKRREDLAYTLQDPIREAVGLPIGTEAEFFVGGGGFLGQDRDPSIAEYNIPPRTQPSLWCQWVPTDDGDAVEWNESEKFYCYTEWLNYIIANMLTPWGRTISGRVLYRGEELRDVGAIEIVDGKAVRVEAKL